MPAVETATADTLVDLAAHIVTSYISRNAVSPADLPNLIVEVHGALAGLSTSPAAELEPLAPAVSIRRSVRPDAIICLECGTAFKTLRLHLSRHHDLTPDDYRSRWNLPRDYPMVAPNYSEVRSRAAKNAGLGRKPTRTSGRKRAR